MTLKTLLIIAGTLFTWVIGYSLTMGIITHNGVATGWQLALALGPLGGAVIAGILAIIKQETR